MVSEGLAWESSDSAKLARGKDRGLGWDIPRRRLLAFWIETLYGDSMTVIESLVRDLSDLPAHKLLEVARFVRRLSSQSSPMREAVFAATAGCMRGTEGEDFEREVRAEADRVDGE